MRIKNRDELVSNGATKVFQKKRRDTLEILSAAVDAVDPYGVVARAFQKKHLLLGAETMDLSRYDHVHVVGFGKASVPMAHAICDAIPVAQGVVITNDPSASPPCRGVEVVVGGHPLPDEGSIRGTDKILALLHRCSLHDCVIMVISGGGSSLLCKPLVPLEDLRTAVRLLQDSGADINELNIVRKHLSQVKGGRLASYTKATIISLILSDVIADPISTIASGPTSPDPSTFSDAKTILLRHGLWERISHRVQSTIEDGIAGRIPETPKQGDAVFKTVRTMVVANNQLACDHAMKKAQELGYEPMLVSTSISGKARQLGRELVSRAKHYRPNSNIALISSGEPTVLVKGTGIGGRNQELVLGCVTDLSGTQVVVASLGTDGIDGNSTAAGAIADGLTLTRAKDFKLDPSVFLLNNDSNTFFRTLHDTIVTGPTGTNVMDIQVILL